MKRVFRPGLRGRVSTPFALAVILVAANCVVICGQPQGSTVSSFVATAAQTGSGPPSMGINRCDNLTSRSNRFYTLAIVPPHF